MTHTKIPSILTIGKATQDVFLRSDEFDPHKEGKVAYTHLPLGAKLAVEEAFFTTGGNATNVATTIARQGLHSKYMWALGTDPASQIIMHELDKEGIDTSHVIQDEEYRSGYSTVLLAPTGERTILSYSGTILPDDGHPLDLSIVSTVDWIYPSSLNSMPLLEKIVTDAKKSGVKVMLNPATPELKEVEKLKSLLEDIDVLCLNKEEMQTLVEGKDMEELVRRGTYLVPVVIVSDGPNGVCASDGKTIVSAGMYEDVPVYDRTGAGDAFASGFLSQWAKGASLEEAIVFASANSTSVVASIGPKAGILHEGTTLHEMPITVKSF